MRTPLLTSVLLFALGTFAQHDTSATKVVKSAPVEMKAAGNVVTTAVSSNIPVAAPLITGDYTICSAHPKCVQGKTTAERTTCTADEVRRHLLMGPGSERPKSMGVIQIDFDVDEYGDVKAIRSNAGSEPDLAKALIVALSSLPKFTAAKKGDARAASHCSFSYTVDELFPAPATSTIPVVVATPTEAPVAPTFSSVQSGAHLITGAFTVPSMHPACAKGTTGSASASKAEEGVRCTADEVLKQIRSKLKAEAPAYLDEVVVDFDIDEYGDVKTIRANCSSEPELGQAVIVALYGLPKFLPAKKDAARVRSHCTFRYPTADLFAAP